MSEEEVVARKDKTTGLFAFITVITGLALLGLFGIDIFEFAMIFIAILVSAIWLITMIFSSIFTLFFCWTNEGFKSFADGFTGLVGDLWGGGESAFGFVKNMFPTYAIVTGSLVGVLLIFGILSFIFTKEEKRPLWKLIVPIVACALFALLLIFGIELYVK